MKGNTCHLALMTSTTGSRPRTLATVVRAGALTAHAVALEARKFAETDDRGETIARYGRVDLLCIDELGYVELDRRGTELLFQVLTGREEKASARTEQTTRTPA